MSCGHGLSSTSKYYNLNDDIHLGPSLPCCFTAKMSSSPKALPESIATSDKMSSPPSSSPHFPNSPLSPINVHPSPLPSGQKRSCPPLSEVISDKFPLFDHQTNIVKPFNEETNRDLIFERGLSLILVDYGSLDAVHAQSLPDFLFAPIFCMHYGAENAHIARLTVSSSKLTSAMLLPFLELSSMLLDAIMQTHAWSSAQSKQQGARAAQNIEEKIVLVIETEKEQGMFPSSPSPPPLPFHTTIVGRQRTIIIHPIPVFFLWDMIADYKLVAFLKTPCGWAVNYRTHTRTATCVCHADEDCFGGAYWWTQHLTLHRSLHRFVRRTGPSGDERERMSPLTKIHELLNHRLRITNAYTYDHLSNSCSAATTCKLVHILHSSDCLNENKYSVGP